MEIAIHISRRYLILIATMAIMFSIITTLLIRHCLTNMVVTLIVIVAVLVTRLLVLLQFSIGVLFRRTTRDKIKFSKCVLSATRPSKVASSGRQVWKTLTSLNIGGARGCTYQNTVYHC